MTKLTTDHSASSYGIPVFVCGGELLENGKGVEGVRKERGWSTAQLGEICGVSARTVEGWEQGRTVPTEAIMRLNHELEQEVKSYQALVDAWDETGQQREALAEFENQVLSVDKDFLPDCALAVLKNKTATREYWEWLTEQLVASDD